MINNNVVFEKITLYVSTQTYGVNDAVTGLDYILEILENQLSTECKVLDYEAELLKLVPKDDEAAPTVPASA